MSFIRERQSLSKQKIYSNNSKRTKGFDIQNINQIDSLLNKNEEIYKNLRLKLQGIATADLNITNNINFIRPISYGTFDNSSRYQNSQYRQSQEKSLEQINQIYENYTSSPIGTQRLLNQSLKRRINGQNSNILIINTQTSLDQQTNLDYNNKQSNRTIKSKNQNPYEYRNVYKDSFMRSQAFEHGKTSNDFRKIDLFNFQNSFKEKQARNLTRDKQNMYFLNQSMPLHVDSLLKSNFLELSKRKDQIQKIYKQLRQQEQEIQKAYQQYKKGFSSVNNASSVGKEDQIRGNSPPKKSSPKKSFEKRKNFEDSPSRMSSIQKKDQSNIKIVNFNETQKTLNMNDTTERIDKSQPMGKSMVRYCTQQFQSIQIPNKPQAMTGRSHIFIPFNKLYKSPIIQMKNQNSLILARQSKLLPQRTSQQKIVDGKKYKYDNIQTDQQQLIKNVVKQDHNLVAIIGGQMTLKKKLHMSLIAHSFDKILKIINSKKYNCLTFTLTYCEYIQKNKSSQTKIQKTVQITEQSTLKVQILQIQKTIEQIYQAIKKPYNSSDSAYSKNPGSNSHKDRIKILRFTKISLLSAKDLIWSCHILSATQYNFQFIKKLQVKDIIWSINPLVKNYDDVVKTLNQATKYSQAKI